MRSNEVILLHFLYSHCFYCNYIFYRFFTYCRIFVYNVVFFLYIFFRWYFRKIKRIEAEKKLLLPENDHGAFLIRDSESRHNDYSLSGNICSANYI